jgi:hypothetical protein
MVKNRIRLEMKQLQTTAFNEGYDIGVEVGKQRLNTLIFGNTNKKLRQDLEDVLERSSF